MKEKRGEFWNEEGGRWIIGLAIFVLVAYFIIFVVLPLFGVNIGRLLGINYG